MPSSGRTGATSIGNLIACLKAHNGVSIPSAVVILSKQVAICAETRANYQSRIALDAVARDFVYLTGEVAKPRRFPFPFRRQATLADALYADGGFSKETGNPGQIYVLRSAACGFWRCHRVASGRKKRQQPAGCDTFQSVAK